MAKNNGFPQKNSMHNTFGRASTTSSGEKVGRPTGTSKNATGKYIPPHRRRGGLASKKLNVSRGKQYRHGNHVREVYKMQQRRSNTAVMHVCQTMDIKDNLIGRFIGYKGMEILRLKLVVKDELADARGVERTRSQDSVQISVCNGKGSTSSVVKMVCRGCTHSEVEIARHFVQNAMEYHRVQNLKEELHKTGQPPPAEHRIKMLLALKAGVQESIPEKSVEQPSTTAHPAAKALPSAASLDLFFSLIARQVYPSRDGWVDVVRDAVKTALESILLIAPSKNDYWTVSRRASSDNSTSFGMSKIKAPWSAYAAEILAVAHIFMRNVIVQADTGRQERLLIAFAQNSLAGLDCVDLCPGSKRNSVECEILERSVTPIRLLWGDTGWKASLPSASLVQAREVRSDLGTRPCSLRWTRGHLFTLP